MEVNVKVKSFLKRTKAVSPVIATIIIVAIAIVMSIAVAYWMLGLGGSFTKYEKVEFTTGYATSNSSAFIVHMIVKNTGSSASTIDPQYILYNGIPAGGYASVPTPQFTTFTLQPGQAYAGELLIGLPRTGGNWTSGMTVEVMLHSAGGKDYPKVVTLP